jgi:hypothetical protein
MTRIIGWTTTLAIVGFFTHQLIFALAEALP